MLIGVVLVLAGIGSIILGITKNNNLEAQVNSLMMSGQANPGTVWIIVGVIAIIIGIAIVYFTQKNKTTP